MRRELLDASALLCLVHHSYDAPWSKVVAVSDAAPRGMAVHEMEWTKEELARVVPYSERWRFRLLEHQRVRERALFSM